MFCDLVNRVDGDGLEIEGKSRIGFLILLTRFEYKIQSQRKNNLHK